jgi:diguanylate cyclase (GGDEF)-like protein/PAS domain S-box-containing protein
MNDEAHPLQQSAQHPLEMLVAVRTAEMTRVNRQLQQEIIERLYSEAALSRALKELESIMEALLDIVYVLDLEGNLLKWNKQLETVTGLSPQELQGRSALAFFPTAEQAMIASAIQEVFTKGKAQVEAHLIGKNAQLLPYEWQGVVLQDHAGNLLGMTGSGRSLTERKQAAEVLRQSEAKFRSLIQNSSDLIVIMQPDGMVQYASPSHQKILGYHPRDLVAQNAFTFVHPEDIDRVAATFAQLVDNQEGTLYAIEFRFRHQDDSWRYLESTGNNLLADPSVQALVINSRDITERKQAEAQMVHNAFHDALTGLPNRTLFMDRLQRAVEHSQRYPKALFAVLFLDLDRFKVINDSLGHSFGDQLLVAIADRLQTCLRPTDTIARIGGDEFTVLLEETAGAHEAMGVAERLQAALAQPFRVSEQVIFTTASIGIVLSSAEQHRPEELLRNADIAMYRAKERGKACCELFDRSMHDRALVRWQLETDLRRAIDSLGVKDEATAPGEQPPGFRVYYQPIVALRTGQISGFEALLRWHHPQRGLIGPSDFFTVAEETGLSHRLTPWILAEACQQVRHWQQTISQVPHLCINVNLSNRQFLQADLPAHIYRVLEQTQLDPTCLKLEITEDVIMESSESAADRLSNLKALGLQLAIDDFGTGYSSLGRLHQFPIDVLKIDRSLINTLAVQEAIGSVAETIVTLARQLGVAVTAERHLACDFGQGFFFAKPLSSQAAEQLLKTNPQW